MWYKHFLQAYFNNALLWSEYNGIQLIYMYLEQFKYRKHQYFGEGVKGVACLCKKGTIKLAVHRVWQFTECAQPV